MTQAHESLPKAYPDRLDRWIIDTQALAARTTDVETRKFAEADLRRWMDERSRHARALQWTRSLNRIAAVLVRVLSFGFVALFVAAFLLKPDNALVAWAVAVDVIIVLASGVLYVVVTTMRDAITQGQQVWRFRLRSLLLVTTVVALILGLWAVCVRI